MTSQKNPIIRPAVPEDETQIADLYLASRADALPTVKVVWDDVATIAWIGKMFHSEGAIYVADLNGIVVGFLRVMGDDLDQLYLRPGYYRMGIGTQLVNKAKELSPGKLRLFTFQVNTRAREFYEHHGFRVVNMNDGSRNEEKEPDILYEWEA